MVDFPRLAKRWPVGPVSGLLTIGLCLLIVGLISRYFFVECQPIFGVDFFPHWATSDVLLHGGNPYDQSAIARGMDRALQEASREFRSENNLTNGTGNSCPASQPFPIYAPPSLLTLLLPFSMFPFSQALLLWLMVSVAVSLVALTLTYRLVGIPFPPKRRLRDLLFLGSFYPLFQSLKLGQVTSLIFFGLSLFLHLRARERTPINDFYAGVALSLSLIKPHLLIPFILFVTVNDLRERRWYTIAGISGGASFLLAIPLLFDTEIYSHYRAAPLADALKWRTPSLGSWLIHSLSERGFLLFIPLVIASLIALLMGARPSGNREEMLPRLFIFIAISICAAPYLWTYDFLLILPVMLWQMSLGSGRLFWLFFMMNSALSFGPWRDMNFFVWYPWVVLIVVLAQQSSTRPTSHEPHSEFAY